jgi:hypothetical protein
MKRKSVDDTKAVTLTTTIFGASDGLVASIALILATMTHGQRVVVAAVVGLLIAEGLAWRPVSSSPIPNETFDRRC